jgi:hypothetical protein
MRNEFIIGKQILTEILHVIVDVDSDDFESISASPDDLPGRIEVLDEVVHLLRERNQAGNLTGSLKRRNKKQFGF